MFERYTEKARRVIFFARYEASQYGSSYIDTEHLLLGLLRENGDFVLRFLRPETTAAHIRAEIEKQITRGERISVSVEVPLSQEGKNMLNVAVEEASNLGNRTVGTEYLLLGMLGSETSLAARLLRERGADAQAIRDYLAKAPISPDIGEVARVRRVSEEEIISQRVQEAIRTLESFLHGLRSNNAEESASYFADSAQFVDCMGKRWIGRDEIEKQFEMLFAPYAKKNVSFRMESSHAGPAKTVLTSILWENVTVGGQPARAMHRVSVVLLDQVGGWKILSAQATPVHLSSTTLLL